MTEKTRLLMAEVQSIFESSTLDSTALALAKTSVEEWLDTNILLQNNSYTKVLNELYAIGDHKLYSIVSVPVDDHYTFHLMPHLKYITNLIGGSAKDYLIQSEDYQREVLGEEMMKFHQLLKEIKNTFKKLTYRIRRATGANNTVVEYPTDEELRAFYECGRKSTYLTKEDVAASLDILNVPYKCVHCGHFHQGKPRKSSEEIPEEVKLVRYKAFWRREHKV